MTTDGSNDDDGGETLGVRDVRAVVRLLGEIGERSDEIVAKRRALMIGLARLVGADGWLWTLTRVDQSGKTPVSLGVIHGGLTSEQLTAWVESSQAIQPPLPEHEPLVQLCGTGRHFTRTRQELVSDERWYGNPTVQRYRLDVGLDHFLYTIYPFESGLLSAIGLYRQAGRPAFSARDRTLAHIVTSEIPWLHGATARSPADPTGESVAGLSRRLRSVLILLLDGKTRKDIARLLRISPHTARDHMVKVYGHFGVSSQLELVKRFNHGTVGEELSPPG